MHIIIQLATYPRKCLSLAEAFGNMVPHMDDSNAEKRTTWCATLSSCVKKDSFECVSLVDHHFTS